MNRMIEMMLAWSPEMIYVAISAVIAVLLWLESTMLRHNAGKMPDTGVFYFVSALGSLWVLVSLAALYFLDFNNITISAPVAYIVYTAANWVYSARVLGQDSIPDNPSEIVLPPKLLSFSQSFALVFFGLCVLILFRPQSFDVFLISP